MRLTKANYYFPEANRAYMSASQFKDFLKCPAYAMDRIEHGSVPTESMLVGSYVDSFLDGDLEKFRTNNPDMFLKSGELKAPFRKAEELCEIIRADKYMYRLLRGNRQPIFTGNIAGVPFKAKLDSLRVDCIVDGKVMKDCNDVWIDGEKKPFYMQYRYDIQAAIYQTLVEQKTGKKFPFLLAVVTKEAVPDKRIFRIKQDVIDDALQEIISLAPYYQAIKDGKEKAEPCGRCEYCRSIKMLTENDIEEV